MLEIAQRFLWSKSRPKNKISSPQKVVKPNTCSSARQLDALSFNSLSGLRNLGLALLASLSLTLLGSSLGSSNVLAANQPTATIIINNGSAISPQTIEPTNSTGANKILSVPVTTGFTYTSTYTMGVGLDCSELTGTKLTNCQAGALVGNEATSALAGTTDGSTATQMQSQGNGAWGYNADKTGDNTTPSSYNKVPVGSNTTNVISASDANGVGKVSAGASQTNKTVTLFFAAGVNGNQASDTYKGNIVVTVVAEPITLLEWVIEYDLDGGTWSGSSTGNQSGTGSAGQEQITTNLRSVIPTKTVGGTSYTFNGWKEVGTDNTYTASASVTLTLDKPILRLKAQWTEVPTMQTFTQAQCTALTEYTGSNESAIVHLVDARDDNKSYLVGKLKDGNCWMLQNLAINAGTTITADKSDFTTTDIPSGSYPIPSDASWSYDTSAYATNGTHLNNTKDTAIANSGTFSTNTGNYYSFLAATAGKGTGSSGNVSASICPKGWKLPTGGSSGQFQTLYNKYGNASSFTKAFKLAATGNCLSGSCPYKNIYAIYWSSTISDASHGYYLYANSGDVNPADGNFKRYGYSVRCILVAAS